MNLEGIVLSEISQIEKTTTTNNGYVNLKKKKGHTQRNRVRRWLLGTKVGKGGDVGQRYKILVRKISSGD